MATYNFELNCRPSQRGTYVVLFRITENKKHKRIKTSVELQSPNDWNPKKQEVRKSDPNFKVLNQTPKRIREQAEEAVHTGRRRERHYFTKRRCDNASWKKGIFIHYFCRRVCSKDLRSWRLSYLHKVYHLSEQAQIFHQ